MMNSLWNPIVTNTILRADSYKASHYLQNPPGAEFGNSYIEARGGRFAVTTFFGLQVLLKAYFSRPLTHEDIDEAKSYLIPHGLPFNETGWRRVVNEFGGKLPVEIWAVPEGTVLPISNVLVQVRNTKPGFEWLAAYIETQLQRAVWYPTTVCSQSWVMKQTIRKWREVTSDDPENLIQFALHDFGARGVSCGEEAMLGGMSHLVNFMGTDTLEALVGARRFYNEYMAGYSVAASEHSTMTAWGRKGEKNAVRNMIEKCGGPGKIVSIVGDTWDIFNFVDNIICGDEIKTLILNSGSKVVVRPDSGEPTEVVPEVLRRLANGFGGATTNSKGYTVLHKQIGAIQGDGIKEFTIDGLLASVEKAKISTENLVLGSGGGLLREVTRDTQKFAQKASSICINGIEQDQFKDPVTDHGKRSKPGRLALRENADGSVETVRLEQCAGRPNLLRKVWADGNLLVNDDLATIRSRAAGKVYAAPMALLEAA